MQSSSEPISQPPPPASAAQPQPSPSLTSLADPSADAASSRSKPARKPKRVPASGEDPAAGVAQTIDKISKANSKAELAKFKVPELKAALKHKGAPVSGNKQDLVDRIWFLQTGEASESTAKPKQRQRRKSKAASDTSASSAGRSARGTAKGKVANDGDEEERPEDAGFAFSNMGTLTAAQKKSNENKSLLDVTDPEFRTTSGGYLGRRNKDGKRLDRQTPMEWDTGNFYKELKARDFGRDIESKKQGRGNEEQKAKGSGSESEAKEWETESESDMSAQGESESY